MAKGFGNRLKKLGLSFGFRVPELAVALADGEAGHAQSDEKAASLLIHLRQWQECSHRKYSNRHDWAFRTLPQLSEYLGCCVRTVQRKLDKLVDMGLIEIRKCQSKRWDQTNHYRVFWDRVLTLLDIGKCSEKEHPPRNSGVGHSDQIEGDRMSNSSNDLNKKVIYEPERCLLEPDDGPVLAPERRRELFRSVREKLSELTPN